jgi:hypothetical protein
MYEKLLKILAVLLTRDRVTALVFAVLEEAKKVAADTSNDFDDRVIDMIIRAAHKVLDDVDGTP